MAVVNANYEFIFVDVGKNGRNSDGGVIELTEFHRKLMEGICHKNLFVNKIEYQLNINNFSGQLKLPENDETENNLNFIFLGDEAFSLHENFLKPFPQKDLSYRHRVFNYRLSRARNVSENAFGLVAGKFRILHTAIHMMDLKNICYVVLAICALHNYLRKRSTGYITPNLIDFEDGATHDLHKGDWRNDAVQLTKLKSTGNKSSTTSAKTNRENYVEYFNADGKVHWQDEMLKKGKA